MRRTMALIVSGGLAVAPLANAAENTRVTVREGWAVCKELQTLSAVHMAALSAKQDAEAYRLLWLGQIAKGACKGIQAFTPATVIDGDTLWGGSTRVKFDNGESGWVPNGGIVLTGGSNAQ